MTEEPRGLTLEPDRCSRHSVGIHASPAEVYLALTDPRELSHWFVAEASIDLRPGGSYRWVFGEGTAAAGPDALVSSGEFVTIVPQEHLRLSTSVEGTETVLEFRFDPWRDGTILTVSHSGFPGEESWDEIFRSVDQGWQSEVQVLKLYMEEARGMLSRSRFHEARLSGTAEQIYRRPRRRRGLAGRRAAPGARGQARHQGPLRRLGPGSLSGDDLAGAGAVDHAPVARGGPGRRLDRPEPGAPPVRAGRQAR
ncbi:MAG: hypothetical protein AUH92_02370 [Acidobacteria bacterium 13_1_40CM_4_69_4]|nr:MAG: hypothetical protein AUH92_02370 [Acidobacteria bacterium 13_1_40CM_4_69_4]